MVDLIGKICRPLEKVFTAVIGLLLLWATLLLCFNVITRYIFGFSLSWAEEMTTYSIIWITFLGCGICVRRGLHVSVDAFVQMLPGNGKWLFKILANLVCLAFSAILLAVGWMLTSKVGASGQLSPAMMIPVKFVYAALPVGAGFMILEYLDVIVNLVVNRSVRSGADDLEQLISGHV